MLKNKYLILICIILTFVPSIAFVSYAYSVSFQQYDGQLVFKTCSGSYITAKSLGSGINPGGPCLMSDAFVLQANKRLYYTSLSVFAAVTIIDSILLYKSRSALVSKR